MRKRGWVDKRSSRARYWFSAVIALSFFFISGSFASHAEEPRFSETLASVVTVPAPSRGGKNPPVVQPTTNHSSARTIEARGDGDARALPDTMFVSIEIEARCDHGAECFKFASQRAEQVAAAIKSKLGSKTEISKTNIALNPLYGMPSPTATPTPGAVGWKFSETIKASADSIDQIGALIDAGLAAGAARVVSSGFDSYGPQPEYANGIYMSQRGPRRMPKNVPHARKPYVMLSVEAEGKSADEAVKQGSQVAERVKRVLADKLGTHGTVWMEDYRVEENQPQNGRYQRRPVQVRQGFTADTTLQVRTHKLDKLASIVEAAAANGAVRIRQVIYTLSDQSNARREAIARACADAQQKAEAAAHSLGVKLGKISKINVGTSVQGENRPGFELRRSVAARAEFVRQSVPHMPVDVHANVNVTYLLE
jgi:uncharacterized protein YggE